MSAQQTASARFAQHNGPAYQNASDALLRDELTDEQESAAQELGRRLLEAKPYLGWEAAVREARKRVKSGAAV